MYVQNVQITDTAIINTYLRAHNTISKFIYTPTQVVNETLLIMEFGNNDTANFIIKDSFFKARKISYPEGVLLIKRYDSTMILQTHVIVVVLLDAILWVYCLTNLFLLYTISILERLMKLKSLLEASPLLILMDNLHFTLILLLPMLFGIILLIGVIALLFHGIIGR